MEISAWIDHWSRWAPEKTALRFEGTSMSYRVLEERVCSTAGGLRARGVARGDRVAYLGPNSPELLELFFACARIGAIFVPLNARMPAPELRVFIDQCRPKLVVAEEGLCEVASASATHGDVVAFSIGDGALRGLDSGGVRVDHDADPTAPVLIAFTSGTTGRPKGAVHTNEGLMANSYDSVMALEITSQDEILTVLPMFHIAGLIVLTLPALSAGATVTIHRTFQPATALKDVERCGITLSVVSPSMLTVMAAEPVWATADLRSMRAQLVGGTTVTDVAIQAWRDRGVPIVQGYGLTEVAEVGIVPLSEVPRKSLTAGKPPLHTRIRITDRDGRDVAPGEPGEILVRGPSVTPGYWHNEKATREAIPDGWFHTGDLGFFDDEGFLHVVDRIKEIIIVGISNVYPGDVEAVLAESAEISEAAVVGLPDSELGEVPVAFIVRAPGSEVTEEEVVALFDGRLAPYKHPRHVVFVDALPRTAIGKVERQALRVLARSQLLGRERTLSPTTPIAVR